MTAADLPAGWAAEQADDGTWTLRRDPGDGGPRQVFTGFESRQSIVNMAEIFRRMQARGPAPRPRLGAR